METRFRQGAAERTRDLRAFHTKFVWTDAKVTLLTVQTPEERTQTQGDRVVLCIRGIMRKKYRSRLVRYVNGQGWSDWLGGVENSHRRAPGVTPAWKTDLGNTQFLGYDGGQKIVSG